MKRNDLDEYIRLCESGRLYESLMRPGVLRDDVKRQLFRNAFYGRPWIRSALGEQFAELFPTVHGLLQELKVRDFRRAAWLMQHLESALFIGTICERIRKERPQTPLVTIHDSLLTTAGHVAYVEEIIRVEFDRIGIRPALRRERY